MCILKMYLLKFMFLSLTFSFGRSFLFWKVLETAKNPFNYLEENNYYYENHTVVTEDGYVLLLVRISNGNGNSSNKIGPPLLFVHGYTGSFNDFLVTGPGVSFGYRAIEEGYDVFFINTRGSRWGRGHKTLDLQKDAKQYWNFSWHEVGIYDLPATIDYITNLTGYSSISYVGHSQGSTCFFPMAAIKPEYNEKIKVSIHLSGSVYMDHSYFIPIIVLKPFTYLIQPVFYALHIYHVFPYNAFLSVSIGKYICGLPNVLVPWCKFFLHDALFGFTKLKQSVLATYYTNSPAGGSVKTAVHYLQTVRAKEFQFFDYGKEKNKEYYRQPTPPLYNMSAVTSPIAFFTGAKDFILPVEDMDRLVKSLPNVVENVKVPLTNHIDVVIGEYAESLVTKPALEIIRKYNDL